jgi:hypothetical protein
VLEVPDVDVLWLDCCRGYSLLARELRDKSTGAVRKRFALGDYREVVAGVWLPGWFEERVFDYVARTPEERERLVSHVRAEVLEVHANDVDEEIFQFQPTPGAAWIDRRTGEYKQTQPGGLELLEAQAARLRTATAVRRPVWMWSIGWLSGILVFLILAGWQGLNRVGRKAGKQLQRWLIAGGVRAKGL